MTPKPVIEHNLPNYQKQIEEELAKYGFFVENWRRAAHKQKKLDK